MRLQPKKSMEYETVERIIDLVAMQLLGDYTSATDNREKVVDMYYGSEDG